jgi:antitoxin component of MazEF toxin-antitoxin module
MPNKKYIRKVVKNGRNSYYINIPKEIVKELKIRERQKLVINKRGKGILIVDWKK